MGGTARTLGYGRDPGGRRTLLTHPDGTQFTSVWDAGGRLLTTSSGALTYIYAVYFPNGLRQAFGTYHTATGFGYDPLLRPNAIAHYFANGSANAVWIDERDPGGGVHTAWRDNDAYAWAGHYATNRGYTTNGLNQYTAAGTATFSYDPNGNLISDGANAYVYDIENRLVSVSGAHNATLVYDPQGRLAAVTSGSSTTRFVYDGDELLAEYNGSGTMTERYLHADGADVPMVTFDGADLSARHYLLADLHGSIIASADADGISGTPNTYDEYGIPGAANTGRFQYTGQAWLAELGMYYYKARIYSPTLGRFLQTDPIGYQGGVNLYTYTGDDPVNLSDPTGLDAEDAAHWAAVHVNSSDYQLSDPELRVGGFRQNFRELWDRGRGAPKCNFFVHDALAAGGIAPNRIQYAADWGNRSSRIETAQGRFRPLTSRETPRAGDVVSEGHHVGIIIRVNRGEEPYVASAAVPQLGDRVTVTHFGFREQDHRENVVVWRYRPNPTACTGARLCPSGGGGGGGH